MNPEVSIIIVNYNTELSLKECLDSIVRNTKNIEYEIIVIDNNSTERDIEKFPQLYKNVKFIFRNKNDGFGGGCNIGIEAACSEYILIVNPDIIFFDNAVKSLYDCIIAYNNIGLLSPVFIDENGKNIYTFNRFPNFKWEFHEFLGMDGTARETEKLLNLLNYHKGANKPFYFDSVTGACMMFKKELFLKIGGFDTNMFLYFEDTDLQKRISNIGYKIACVPAVKVIHQQNISTKKSGDENSFILNLNRSKIIYYLKHAGVLRRSLIRLMNIISYTFRLLILFFRKKYKSRRKQKIFQYKEIIKYNLFYHTIKKEKNI